MKTIRKGFALLFKITLLALLVAVLSPTLYFAWRAGQPMELTEFKGLTYYEYLDWRSIAHNDLEVKYKTSHAEVEVKMGLCEDSDRLITFTVGVGQSMWYTFLSWHDDRNRLEMLEANYPAANEPVSWSNFMSSWWQSYEKLILSLAEYKPHTSVAYCRIQPNIPTPEEFEALKLEHQLSAVQ